MVLKFRKTNHINRQGITQPNRVSFFFLVILFFLTGSFREFEKKIAAQRSLDFSQTNYHLNWGFPYGLIHRLFYPFGEHQLGKNNFHHR